MRWTFSQSRRGACHGFSLVELLVVLCIACVLLALAVPSLSRVMAQARLTRSLAQIRGNGTLLVAYCQEHRDTFPVAGSNAVHAAWDWYKPLVDAGTVPSREVLDPEGVRRGSHVTFLMSVCMVFDPAKMVPGKTPPPDEQYSTRVFQHQVVFPASKGLMHQWRRANGAEEYYGTITPFVFPVLFADLSGETGTARSFSFDDTPYVDENNFGVPVWTTWGGYLSQDRRGGSQ